MTWATQRIPYRLADADAAAGRVWIRLEQEQDEDVASPGEVAAVVDEIYQLDPCEEEAAPDSAPEPRQMRGPLTEEEAEEIIKRQFQPGLCGQLTDGSWLALLRVYRSDPGVDYRLQIQGGSAGEAAEVSEQVDLWQQVDGQSELTLEKPVLGSFSASWNGAVVTSGGVAAGPPITRNGSTISWGVAVTGSLRLRYQSVYDLVEVTVPPTDEGDGQAVAIAFYHGLVDELALQQPEVDEADAIYREKFCGSGQLGGQEKRDTIDCYEVRTLLYRCQCSGEVAWTAEEEVSVPCPSDLSKCPEGLDECRACVGYRDVTADYVDCGETTGDIADPEFYKEKCCHYPTYELPRCSTYYRQNQGGIELSAEARAPYLAAHDLVEFVAVSPADGDCGHTKYVQSLVPKNCCDGVPELSWDYEATPDVLPRGSQITVFAEGGIPPYTFQVFSSQLVFPSGGKSLVTGSRSAVVLAGPDFCGSAVVRVRDACSSADLIIRSDQGEWLPRADLANQCILPGHAATYTAIPSVSYWRAEAISGKWRAVETQGWYPYTTSPGVDPSYHLVNNKIQGGGEGCPLVVGGCSPDYYYWCTYATCSREQAFHGFFDSCVPGNRYHPSTGDGLLAGRVCLAAGSPDNILPVDALYELRHEGRLWEMVIDAGVSTGYVCNETNLAARFRKQYVGRGPGGLQVWEWIC